MGVDSGDWIRAQERLRAAERRLREDESTLAWQRHMQQHMHPPTTGFTTTTNNGYTTGSTIHIGPVEQFQLQRRLPPPVTVAGPIVAWRLWKVHSSGLLQSVAHSTRWWPGIPMEGESAPGTMAGVYAMKRREMLDELGYSKECVPGTVALWGRVIEHEKGYRAQYAYPVMVDLSIPTPMAGFPVPPARRRLAQAIRDQYGCEVLDGAR